MAYTDLIYSKENRVATITLNRPKTYNALNPTLFKELREVFAEADNDDDVGAIIFTGAGKAFCSGADMQAVGARAAASDQPRPERTSEPADKPRRRRGMFPYLLDLRTPVIGAINGVCAGIGFIFPLYFDFRIAAQSARLGTIFSRRGLTIEDATAYFLPRVVGLGNALDLVVTGRMITADEALKMGYLREVVPDDQLIPRAHEIAQDIAQNCSAISIAQSRRMIMEHLSSDYDTIIADANDVTRWMYSLDDIKEGVKAFVEKRPPRFRDPKTMPNPKARNG
ncbi:MAG: enoyl-CoA hydratase-related protein [Candidatus Binataceae bacterium]